MTYAVVRRRGLGIVADTATAPGSLKYPFASQSAAISYIIGLLPSVPQSALTVVAREGLTGATEANAGIFPPAGRANGVTIWIDPNNTTSFIDGIDRYTVGDIAALFQPLPPPPPPPPPVVIVPPPTGNYGGGEVGPPQPILQPVVPPPPVILEGPPPSVGLTLSPATGGVDIYAPPPAPVLTATDGGDVTASPAPAITTAGSTVPTWAWAAGGAVLAVLLFGRKRS